jgi:hypothetical protein
MSSAKQVLLGYVIIAIIITLIVWYVEPSLVWAVVVWFFFILILMFAMSKQCLCKGLIYLAIAAFVPVIFLLLFSSCGNSKPHKRN